jgi:hypothetical protein
MRHGELSRVVPMRAHGLLLPNAALFAFTTGEISALVGKPSSRRDACLRHLVFLFPTA